MERRDMRGWNRIWIQGISILLLLGTPLWSLSQEDQISLSLDNADVLDLIRWASSFTDKNIIIHPNVKGRVSVMAGEPMNAEEAYEVFLSVLQVNELAIVETEGSLKVIPEALAKQSALPVSDSDVITTREDMIVQIVTVKNVSVANILNLLRPLAPQTSYMAAYPQTNKLIIADRANNIKQLMRLIDRIDLAGSFDIEIVKVLYASARDLQEIVERLIPKQSGGEVSAYNLTIDERSNSILMTGDPVIRQQIKTLIQNLDTPLDGIGNTQIIPIQYSDAADLVPILDSMSKSVDPGSDKTAIPISIQAHPSLNSLIVTAPPSMLGTFKALIEGLDIPRPQVLVEAIIVEVNLDTLAELGVEWSRDVNQPTNFGTAGGVNLTPNSLSPLTVTENGAVTLGSGLSLGYFRGGNIHALFTALAGESNANILSTPSIVALDNEQASILVGENVPFITGTENRQGSEPFQTIQRQDIGITLKVKPRINNNSSVTLDIEQSVESITQTAANTADIVTNKREISTRVLIGNDEILVLGGLIRDEITESRSKVPILGDIPLIGRAFRNTTNDIDKRNLMVFIHPVILDSPATRQKVSDEKYEYMRGLQSDFSERVDRIFIPGPLPKLPERVVQSEHAELANPISSSAENAEVDQNPEPDQLLKQNQE